MRILVVGGCHVEMSNQFHNTGFVKHLKEKLISQNIQPEITIISTLPLTHLKELESVLENNSFDLMILQLGNYEFSLSLKSYFSNTRMKLSEVGADTQVSIQILKKGANNGF